MLIKVANWIQLASVVTSLTAVKVACYLCTATLPRMCLHRDRILKWQYVLLVGSILDTHVKITKLQCQLKFKLLDYHFITAAVCGKSFLRTVSYM